MIEQTAAAPWQDALLAAAVLAVDPVALKGVHLRAAPGPARDAWLDHLASLLPNDAPRRRFGPSTSMESLSGGLDLAATLSAGRPVDSDGILASSDGGLLICAMAERLPARSAALIAQTLDDGRAPCIDRRGDPLPRKARFLLVTLDEGIEDERLHPALAERLAIRLDLDGLRPLPTDSAPDIGAVMKARQVLPFVHMPEELIASLCALAEAAGNISARASLALLRVVRALAALRGAHNVNTDDCIDAARLVLGICIASAPETEVAESEPPPQPEKSPASENESEREAADALPKGEIVLDAIRTALPLALFEAARRRGKPRQQGQATSGRAPEKRKAKRGRPIEASDRPPFPGARPDVLATLRAAAPWQAARRRHDTNTTADRPIRVRKRDFRFARFEETIGTTAICAVDASGSAAFERLAETKGAIEFLLSRCYARRDSVALIAFRGCAATTLLEPTRSLARAKRLLAALPGGGGTPLAAGIRAALDMAMSIKRKGGAPVVFLLTDGRGNVALDGGTARDKVADEVAAAARLARKLGIEVVVVDTANRPQLRARELAAAMGARYAPLPFANAARLGEELELGMIAAKADAVFA